MVDRLLDAVGLVGRRAHEDACRAGIIGRQVARFDPVHAIRRRAVLPGLQVTDQPCEAAALRDLGDHPIPRMADKTSSSAACNRSRAMS
jgi:hypothetical protein